MEKKLEEYLNHLSNAKKSKSSIKNYKADIKSFLLWRQESAPEKSLTIAFKNYKSHLLSIYSVNSVIRKTSSIKGFIEFAFPFENLEVQRNRTSRKTMLFISTLTVSLCLITTLAIALSFMQTQKVSKVLGLNDRIVVSNENSFPPMNNRQGLAVVVSAPQTEAQEGNTQIQNFSDKQDSTISSIETSGNGKIEKGQSQTTIYTPLAEKDSSVYLTAYSPNANLYIKEVSNGFFIVANNNSDTEISFKWMLKNTENNISIF